MGHPSLTDYDIDQDYLDIDNRDTESTVARQAITEDDETPDDGPERVCETCQSRDSYHETGTHNSQETSKSGESSATRQTAPDGESVKSASHTRKESVDASHLLYQGRASESTRDRNMELNVISPTSNDGRSVTRTYWQPRDVPNAKQEQYRRLLQWQEGQWTPERDAQNKQADTRRVIDVFGSRLDCTDHQVATVESIIEQTNLKHMGPYSYQHSVLGAYAIATFITDQRDVKGTPKYRELVEAIGSDPKEMRNIRRLLRTKSSYFE